MGEVTLRRRIHLLVSVAYCCFLTAHAVEGTKNCSRSYFGSDGPGILQSYNYPFDVMEDLSCQYRIMVDHLDPDVDNFICFLFRRFLMDRYSHLTFHDRATDSEYTYHLLGTLVDDDVGEYIDLDLEHEDAFLGRRSSQEGGDLLASMGSTEPFKRDHLWYNPFCWIIAADDMGRGYFMLDFESNHQAEGTGFYAHYDIISGNATNATSVIDTMVDFMDHLSVDNDAVGTLYPDVNEEVPCPGINFTCFNRHCARLRDICPYTTNDSCGDGSGLSYAHARCTNDISFKACDFQQNLGNITTVRWEENTNYRFDDMRGGPDRDHTTMEDRSGKGDLYWTAFTVPNERAEMVDNSVLFDDTYSGTHCFSFWYFMYGNDVGTLGVYFSGDTARAAPLWMRSGSYGDQWRHGEVEIENSFLQQHRGEKLLFSALHASDMSTVISLDDVTLYKGTCSGDDLSCSFETGSCSWVQDTDSWQLHSGVYNNSARMTVPGDHTTDTGDGHYLVFDSLLRNSTSHDNLTGPVYTYVSVEPVQTACLTLWVFASLSFDHTASLLEVRTRDNAGREVLHRTLVAKEDILRNGLWQKIRMDITAESPYQLKLAALNDTDKMFLLALDDVTLLSGKCADIDESSCPYGQFKCSDETCIDSSLVFDGKSDCNNSADEQEFASCLNGDCAYGEFCCLDGGCVALYMTCDRYKGCDDWSDEDYCEDEYCGRFPCSGDTWRCLDDSYVCDGMLDCPLGDDEENCVYWKTAIAVGVCITAAMLATIVLLVLCLTRDTKNAETTDRHQEALAAGNPHQMAPSPTATPSGDFPGAGGQPVGAAAAQAYGHPTSMPYYSNYGYDGASGAAASIIAHPHEPPPEYTESCETGKQPL